MNSLRSIPILLVLLAVSGCAYIHRWIDGQILGEPDAVVEKIDPTYLALPPPAPYSGVYPGNLAFNITTLEPQFPVLENVTGPRDQSLGMPQQPFACESVSSDLGPPLQDNTSGFGVPTSNLGGYSQHCELPTSYAYYYKAVGEDGLQQLPDTLPTDVEMVVWEGLSQPFVVRIEQGTINRFIYTLAVPADPLEALATPTPALWNKHLIYYFNGGIGVGKRQGMRHDFYLKNRLNDLRKGYAVVMSTGTATETHYNMWVARNTAEMVKLQFTKLYGDPVKTIGVGESGGAIQQYLFAEARPGFLDALIPVYSYPDVETQVIWASDCELLEYYFDVTARRNERWEDFEQRTLLEGLSSDAHGVNRFYLVDNLARIFSWRGLRSIRGVGECSRGWRLSVPLIENPRTTHMKLWYSPEVFAVNNFDHYDDLKEIYGVNADGFANRVFDNVGVQYALDSLKRGEISWAEFLHLNANIGGWKPAKDFTEAKLWLAEEDRSFSEFSIWGEHNMTTPLVPRVPMSVFEPHAATVINIAPRSIGNLAAMKAAYKSGHVFLGKVDPTLPILDVRHYVDPFLDIHHSFASISTRMRIQREQGSLGMMRIWVAEFPNESHWFKGIDPVESENEERRLRLQLVVDKALDAMRNWMDNGVDPQDACFNQVMTPIAQGPLVWDGDWNGQPAGVCTERFPHFETPRNAAGAPLEGDMFKCERITVAQAKIADAWAPLDPTPYEDALNAVFPDGVCDYSQDDSAK